MANEDHTSYAVKIKVEAEQAAKSTRHLGITIRNALLGAVAAATGAMMALGAAIGAVLGVIGLLIKASKETQQAQAVLANSVRNLGAAAGVTYQQMWSLAEAMAANTTYSRETVAGAEAIVLSFKNIAPVFIQPAVVAAANLATVLGTDLPTAAKQLAAALESPGKRLGELRNAGLRLTDEFVEQMKALDKLGLKYKAQEEILLKVKERFGGAAAAAGATPAARMEQAQRALKAEFADIGVILANKLGLTSATGDILGAVYTFIGKVEAAGPAIADFLYASFQYIIDLAKFIAKQIEIVAKWAWKQLNKTGYYRNVAQAEYYSGRAEYYRSRMAPFSEIDKESPGYAQYKEWESYAKTYEQLAKERMESIYKADEAFADLGTESRNLAELFKAIISSAANAPAYSPPAMPSEEVPSAPRQQMKFDWGKYVRGLKVSKSRWSGRGGGIMQMAEDSLAQLQGFDAVLRDILTDLGDMWNQFAQVAMQAVDRATSAIVDMFMGMKVKAKDVLKDIARMFLEFFVKKGVFMLLSSLFTGGGQAAGLFANMGGMNFGGAPTGSWNPSQSFHGGPPPAGGTVIQMFNTTPETWSKVNRRHIRRDNKTVTGLMSRDLASVQY